MKAWIVIVLGIMITSGLVLADPTAVMDSSNLVEGTNTSANSFVINITSNETINVSSYVTWINQSGDGTNFTFTFINNATDTNYTSINISENILDGSHSFFGVILGNGSNVLNTTSERRNYTQDDTNPSVSFTEPTNGSVIRISSNAVKIIATLSDDTSGLDQCFLEVNAVNTSFSCANLETTITSIGGINTVKLYVNDSTNNQNNPQIMFDFSLQSGSGGGGAPISRPLITTPVVAPAAPTVVAPSQTIIQSFIDSISRLFSSLFATVSISEPTAQVTNTIPEPLLPPISRPAPQQQETLGDIIIRMLQGG